MQSWQLVSKCSKTILKECWPLKPPSVRHKLKFLKIYHASRQFKSSWNEIIFFSDFAAQPYCPSGFTYGFWTRFFEKPGSDDDTLHYLVSQADYLDYGIGIRYRHAHGILFDLQFPSAYHACSFYSSRHVPVRKWVFLGMTYDPVTTDSYCFYGNEYKKMSVLSQTQSAPKPFAFAGNIPFFLDNVFYFPKYSTADEISAIYNLSEFLSILLFIIHFSPANNQDIF